MCSGICIIRSAAFSDVGTRWPGLGTGSFPRRPSLGSWVFWLLTDFRGSPLRMPPVKPVREPDDRNGHVRFDERGRETERWASRREQPRKTLLAAGAAGPVRHRAHPRLYQSGHEFSVGAEPPRSLGSRCTGIVNVNVDPLVDVDLHQHHLALRGLGQLPRGLARPSGTDHTIRPRSPRAPDPVPPPAPRQSFARSD
jgi:hypothetical protein